MKRPMIWVVGILLIFFLAVRFFCGDKLEEKHYSMSRMLQETNQAMVCGTLDHIEVKPKSYFFYLKKVSVTLSHRKKIFYYSDFLAIISECRKDSYQPGNVLQISGSIQSFTSPTNPGQFDEKSYYKEKNIYFKMYGDTCKIIDAKRNPYLTVLYQIKDRWKQVYEECLPEKEAGILTAMLLGDKSILDMDVRELYQVNGIGHLLAISGLHISILCMALYGGLRRFPLPERLPFLITIFFLLAYGRMTGLGISTSRAVIMMFLLLLGKEWGRSYDGLTAMGFSAGIIWLQKPYAIFSSSFLLSYGAMAGVYLVLPAMQIFFRGTWQEQQTGLRKRKRKQRELAANRKSGKIMLFLQRKITQAASSLLCSFSIWLATVPILCYFFYEFPTYGIILNVFVLPLASVLVISGMLGGVLGIFFLPAGKLFLWIAEGILFFYEKVCILFQQLPEPIQITGQPEWKNIFFYYGILIILCFLLLKGIYRREKFVKYSRIMLFFCLTAGLFLLFHPRNISGFFCTFLDVGQGDGILLQTDTGKTILVDGGSTSVSQVGKYRIIPCLKYYGIHSIDYMIMTHEDEDHISGQRELLETGKKRGITVGCLLLPEPDSSSQGENYHQMERLANKAKIPCQKIHQGDKLSIGQLQITCLHPDKDFAADSANAYSTTLDVRYGKSSLLLTGDLEKNGENAVLDFLGAYDILKVAHHGSKNSSSRQYLAKIQPKAAVISCGKDNRYGHPHQELLQRLEPYTKAIYRTDEKGAVFLYTEGRSWQIGTYN